MDLLRFNCIFLPRLCLRIHILSLFLHVNIFTHSSFDPNNESFSLASLYNWNNMKGRMSEAIKYISKRKKELCNSLDIESLISSTTTSDRSSTNTTNTANGLPMMANCLCCCCWPAYRCCLSLSLIDMIITAALYYRSADLFMQNFYHLLVFLSLF